MTGVFGIIKEKQNYDLDDIVETINPFRLSKNEILNHKLGTFVVSYLEKSHLASSRSYQDEDWILIINGDIIEQSNFSFSEIIKSLENKNFGYFKNLNGIFSIAALHLKKNKLFFISDRFSISPLYYLLNKIGFFFSSALSTFCRLDKDIEFNENWLFEYLFFNYPIGENTFLKNVKRIPAASVLELDLNSKEISLKNYSKKFNSSENLLTGTEALNKALNLFSERILKYYESSSQKVCSLTGGWDSRTILAFCPDLKDMKTYTYGIEGCDDLIGATETADSINVSHKKIFLNDELIETLPKDILNTVFASSGIQGILRSDLIFIYKQLFNSENPSIYLSGIFFDNIYRGHMNFPAQISKEMKDIMKNIPSISFEFFRMLLRPEYFEFFEEDISKKLEELKDKYGDFKSSEFHLTYQLYETLRYYFGGEVSIANEFGTLRIPALDSHLVRYAYNSEYSALHFSEYAGHERSDEENILQSCLISNNNKNLANVQIGNLVSPDKILKGEKYFLLYCKYKKILIKISELLNRNKITVPLEDWNLWLNQYHKDFIDELIFSNNTMIKKYIKDEYLRDLKNDRNLHLIGKFTTIEIILRLINNGWRRFW